MMQGLFVGQFESEFRRQNRFHRRDAENQEIEYRILDPGYCNVASYTLHVTGSPLSPLRRGMGRGEKVLISDT
jgi:hypothetical protein